MLSGCRVGGRPRILPDAFLLFSVMKFCPCTSASASQASYLPERPSNVITSTQRLVHLHGCFWRHSRPVSCTMRTAFLLGRQCLRQGLQPFPHFVARAPARPLFSAARRQLATPRFGGRTLLWSGAAAAGGAILSPLAFVEISHDESGSGEKTHEEAMLEASRKELAEQVPKSLKNSKKYRRGIYFFLEDYIIEPIATGLRFLHLVIIFVPVIVTLPALWIGTRRADRDNERSGTLWWYGFLVGSMERAGAAFIKVCI